MRHYAAKRPRWQSKVARASAAAKLRARGLSLRQIADELVVSHETVRTDLQRWDAQHANVVPLSRNGVKTRPRAGRNLTPEFDSSAPLRSQA